MIVWASVIEERNRLIALGPQLAPPPTTGKRKVGRPKAAHEPKPPTRKGKRVSVPTAETAR